MMIYSYCTYHSARHATHKETWTTDGDNHEFAYVCAECEARIALRLDPVNFPDWRIAPVKNY